MSLFGSIATAPADSYESHGGSLESAFSQSLIAGAG
jgi:hypothetical protein